ncbi:sentrin-specific protease 7-like isoform X2 [Lampris incognitus]|uniref:sentrin-specific protease 7-like isoform X2 n=1 Tax=Lampris incognitus TaxID=2546036 RepID=UPI0024B5C86F|nr:sentrin-specific protease 7-like isoform X2 [Lampris incognitus]
MTMQMMASSFRIPKKKQPTEADIRMQSPLSCLQDGSGPFKNSWGESNRVACGNRLGATVQRKSKPLFRDVVLSTLGLHRPKKGTSDVSTASMRPGSADEQSKWRPDTPLNRWRPKRASDRLQPERSPSRSSEPLSSVKIPTTFLTDSFPSYHLGRDSVLSVSSDAELGKSFIKLSAMEEPGLGHSNGGMRKKREFSEASWDRQKKCPKSGTSGTASYCSSDEDISSPSKTRASVNKMDSADPLKEPSPSSTVAFSSHLLSAAQKYDNRRLSINCNSLLNARHKLRFYERHWKMGVERDRKRGASSRSLSLHLNPSKAKQMPSEPIVLSSEEEEDEKDERDAEVRMSEASSRVENSPLNHTAGQQTQEEKKRSGVEEGPGAEVVDRSLPSFVELDFTALHVGLSRAEANGKMMIMESGINMPVKGSQGVEGEFAVTVVASQVRGYGVWDGCVVQGGGILPGAWEGPAPSLLFLWVTDAQANLLQRELSAIQPVTQPGHVCPCLLLVLREQISELQGALLSSLLEMKDYLLSRFEPCSPLDLDQGLVILHSLPPPLHTHLLGLLGQNVGQSSQKKRKSCQQPSSLQRLPGSLIQYPAAPCKGRITVTTEDLACLERGEFLNDVIIDFYLKFLLLERAESSVAERCHVFSSFFFKQLARRRVAGEDDAPVILDRKMRHKRVKTWTRHVDIFTKDFLFVPVNQQSHWYLAIICFPGLEEVQYQEWHGPARKEDKGVRDQLRPRAEGPSLASDSSSSLLPSTADKARGKSELSNVRSHTPPGCTQQGLQRKVVLRRPCILVMDSLKLSDHENICRLLRDYLHVEWEVRRGTNRLFTTNTVMHSSCRVPLQDNSSDCGLYLLQYVESFLLNPVVHFDLPLTLEHWFPRDQVRRKREEIRSLVMQMHKSQGS